MRCLFNFGVMHACRQSPAGMAPSGRFAAETVQRPEVPRDGRRARDRDQQAAKSSGMVRQGVFARGRCRLFQLDIREATEIALLTNPLALVTLDSPHATSMHYTTVQRPPNPPTFISRTQSATGGAFRLMTAGKKLRARDLRAR